MPNARTGLEPSFGDAESRASEIGHNKSNVEEPASVYIEKRQVRADGKTETAKTCKNDRRLKPLATHIKISPNNHMKAMVLKKPILRSFFRFDATTGKPETVITGVLTS